MSTAKEIQTQATGAGVDIRLVEAGGAPAEHVRGMTQLDLIAPCRVPPKGGQCHALLTAMKNGERLTVARALSQYHCYALSQRCGELRREYGWPIKSEFMETTGGARVKVYWLE